MEPCHRRFIARRVHRRLYRWRRAAALSVISLVAWLVRTRSARLAAPGRWPRPGLPLAKPAGRMSGR